MVVVGEFSDLRLLLPRLPQAEVRPMARRGEGGTKASLMGRYIYSSLSLRGGKAKIPRPRTAPGGRLVPVSGCV